MANDYFVNTEDLISVADAIREKTRTTENLVFPIGFVEAISEIKTGGTDALKAFVPIPLTGEIHTKSVVPIIETKYVSAYTNTSTNISATFNSGNIGDVHILALAVRNASSEPVLPDGWEKILWSEKIPSNSTTQKLLVAKFTTSDHNANTDISVSFDVINGQRNYLMILSIGDSDVDVESALVTSGETNVFEQELYEHTLLICSATLTGTYVDDTAWAAKSGYYVLNNPSYTDNSGAGGRLGITYFPYLSQQPFSKATIETYTNVNNGNYLTCALRLIPRTPYKNVCII